MVSEIDELDQEVQTSHHKMRKSWECKVLHRNTVTNTIPDLYSNRNLLDLS